MKKQSLYDVLSDGEWHSGQELADQFGVSRTGIWKQIAKLRESGVDIESSQGKGYKLLAASPTLFQRNVLSAALSESAQNDLVDVLLFERIASTNDNCMSWIGESSESTSGDVLVLAEQQIAGRGRRGKTWVSPYGASIYMSLSQRFDSGVAGLSGLSLVVGIAVAQAIERFTHSNAVQLKWPNDVYVAGKKLGGILLEVVGDLSGPCHAVIGIGVNVTIPLSDANGIDQPYTTLSQSFPDVAWDKNLLVAEIVNQLYALLPEFRVSGFGVFFERWSSRDLFVGQEVMVKVSDEQFELGGYEGVDESGALCVRTPSGRKTFAGGEVSLRPAL